MAAKKEGKEGSEEDNKEEGFKEEASLVLFPLNKNPS